MFEYNYREIDLFDLRNAGIRTFREIEEMIEGYSIADRIEGPGRYYEFIGFTSESTPLEVTIKEEDGPELVILEIRKPHVREIVNNFCRYFKTTNYPDN